MAKTKHEDTSGDLSLDRLVFFSDAVFAIAMTLLVLPLVGGRTDLPVWEQIKHKVPELYAFALSFWVIGLYWIGHHRVYRRVRAYDEGLMLFGADRVLRGDVPYRDFWTSYGPAGFYVDALLFRVFGEFALVGRGFDAAVKAAIVGLAFAIVRRFGRAGLATAAALLVLGLLIYLRNYGVPVFPAVAASLVAVLALDAVATRASRRAAALAGVAVGSALLFRHDLGAYAAVGSLVFIAFGALPARSGDTAAGDRRALFVRFAGGLLVVVAPVAVWLLAVVPLHDLAFSLVEVPLRVYPKVRALPFPSLADAAAEFGTQRSLASLGPLVVYLPVVAVAIGVASEVSRSSVSR